MVLKNRRGVEVKPLNELKVYNSLRKALIKSGIVGKTWANKKTSTNKNSVKYWFYW